MSTLRNYKAWRVHPDQFPKDGTMRDRILHFLEYAILAPSSHNSQPWKFRMLEDAVQFVIDERRLLPVADPDGRLLHIAFGAAVENLCVAADYFGYNTKVTFHENDSSGVATVRFFLRDEPGSQDDDHLFHAIRKRRSHRGPLALKELPAALREHIEEVSCEDIQAHALQGEKKDAVRAALQQFREEAFDRPSFRHELSTYKRHNLTRAHTGIPGFTMGFSLLKSLIAPSIIKRVNVAKKLRGKENDQTDALVLFSSKKNSAKDWFLIGRMLQQTLLAATHMGLQSSIQLSPHEGAIAQTIQNTLNTDYSPHICIRIGRGESEARPSPRLSIDTMVIH